MGYRDFYKKLNSMNDREYIENMLLYSVSQVIAEIKPASTVTIKKSDLKLFRSWHMYGKKFLMDINLDFIELRENKNVIILLIYNKEVLYKYLFEDKVNNLLIKLGYGNYKSIEGYLRTLQYRYNLYNCPHELGVFLGIPYEDVVDFMECSEKRCLLCGYWKVYNNFNTAKEIFNNYDKVKEFVFKKIINNEMTKDIADQIKNFNY